MFQSLSMEQLQTCLQMAVQQLISTAADTDNTNADALLQQQQKDQQQQQDNQELAGMPQTVTNLSTDQMQQLLQLQQQSALSMLNQPNVSYIFLCINGTIAFLT